MQSKKWAIVGLSCFALVWCFSLVFYTNYLSSIPFIAHLQNGYQILQGYPTPVNGRMWRLNETNYLVETKGSIINLRSNYPLGNYSTCYTITMLINTGNLTVSFDRNIISGITTQKECLSR